MKKVIVLFLVLFCVGCASVEKLEKEWVGRDKTVLIAVKGAPDKIMSDGFGGEIYTYSNYVTYPDTYGPYYGWPYYDYYYPHHYGYGYYHNQAVTSSGGTSFWIDPAGKIYKVSLAD